MKRRSLALAAASMLAALPSLAQDKPPIRILVGFPPGGSADIVARLLADKMRVTLGQPVVVDNKPGAAGRVALGEVKRAAPDGQTLVLAPSGALVVSPWLYKNLGFDPVSDFTPLARVVTFDFAITAGPAAPAGDLKSDPRVDERQPRQGQLRHAGRRHGAPLHRRAVEPGRRHPDDARGLQGRRAGGATTCSAARSR